MTLQIPQLIANGFYFPAEDLPNSPTGFNPSKPYCGCSLCGEVFQSALDLKVPSGHNSPSDSLIAKYAWERRQRWRRAHKCHQLKTSPSSTKRPGTFATPVAAQKLSYLGIFSITDMVLDDEISQALKEA